MAADDPTVTVALLGLGEAGAAIAGDLGAVGRVRGWDPDPTRRPAGVELASTAAEAVRGAAVVLSVNAATAAVPAASAALPALAPGVLYADLNTGSARLKREVAEIVESAGATFADVALMAPVPGRGASTPFLVSGDGAEALAQLFRPLGARVEVLEGGPGAAATRKLLRSVFMKGLAAAVLEGLAGAEAAGCADWFRANVAETLDHADAALLDRLVVGSRAHAARRVHELEASSELLRDLGVEPRVAEAARSLLDELVSG